MQYLSLRNFREKGSDISTSAGGPMELRKAEPQIGDQILHLTGDVRQGLET
jgi:hypothetical protein